jgi:hypothetical protein
MSDVLPILVVAVISAQTAAFVAQIPLWFVPLGFWLGVVIGGGGSLPPSPPFLSPPWGGLFRFSWGSNPWGARVVPPLLPPWYMAMGLTRPSDCLRRFLGPGLRLSCRSCPSQRPSDAGKARYLSRRRGY